MAWKWHVDIKRNTHDTSHKHKNIGFIDFLCFNQCLTDDKGNLLCFASNLKYIGNLLLTNCINF